MEEKKRKPDVKQEEQSSKKTKIASGDVFQNLKISITGNLDRTALQEQIKSNSGEFSSVVSKKIAFLVATEEAILDNTQRIRKAVKYARPIVRESYITECINQKKLLPITEDFELKPKSTKI
eukprot:TRINITY_DN9766_c0_g1_i1.p1 TRINITY_DN9766_c0_g1~~TRINITY_DN9766_c0_g1_i1.p1  ORF type:complete len:122 (-),score=36.32 TRINITY_DN9766_c0_g1_i1:171-536(-)